MLSKKGLAAIAIAGTIALGGGIGAGTYAYFTSTATSTNNTITAGTLKMNTDTTNAVGTVTTDISDTNFYPGATVSVNDVKIENKGTLDFKYRMSVNVPENPTLLYNGENGLDITVTYTDDNNVVQTYTSKLDDFGYLELGTVEDGTTENIDIQLSLPTAADNDYQELAENFTFNFEATQTTNNGWTE